MVRAALRWAVQNWFPVSETVIERLRRYKLSRLALCPGCEFPGRGSEDETRPAARSVNGFRRSRTCQCPLPLAVSKGVGSLKGQSGSRSVCQGYRKRNLPASTVVPRCVRESQAYLAETDASSGHAHAGHLPCGLGAGVAGRFLLHI